MVQGRTSEVRTASITSTTGSAAITAAAGTFMAGDAGRPISGTGIPAGATILSVQSATAATLSANATTTGAATRTIGAANSQYQDSQRYGFHGWSPETEAEAATYTVAANNAGTPTPDRLTNTVTPFDRGRARG